MQNTNTPDTRTATVGVVEIEEADVASRSTSSSAGSTLSTTAGNEGATTIAMDDEEEEEEEEEESTDEMVEADATEESDGVTVAVLDSAKAMLAVMVWRGSTAIIPEDDEDTMEDSESALDVDESDSRLEDEPEADMDAETEEEEEEAPEDADTLPEETLLVSEDVCADTDSVELLICVAKSRDSGVSAELELMEEETPLELMEEETPLELMDEETSLELMDEETSLELMDEETSLELMDEETSLELMDEDTSVAVGLELEDGSETLEERDAPMGETASQAPNSDWHPVPQYAPVPPLISLVHIYHRTILKTYQ
jgi:hypothetical protein